MEISLMGKESMEKSSSKMEPPTRDQSRIKNQMEMELLFEQMESLFQQISETVRLTHQEFWKFLMKRL